MNEQSQRIDIQEFLSKVELFSSLSTQDLSKLASGSRIRTLSAKEILFVEGDSAEKGFVVVSGRMALLKESSSGKELIFELLPRGEIIGIPLVVNRRSYPVTARAQVATTLVEIPSAPLFVLVNSHPQLLKGMMQIMSQRIEQSQHLARSLAHDRVEVRIASALLALIPRFGTSASDDAIEIVMSRQELADITGITLETASRVARSFESLGLIGLSDLSRVKILDANRLAEIAAT